MIEHRIAPPAWAERAKQALKDKREWEDGLARAERDVIVCAFLRDLSAFGIRAGTGDVHFDLRYGDNWATAQIDGMEFGYVRDPEMFGDEAHTLVLQAPCPCKRKECRYGARFSKPIHTMADLGAALEWARDVEPCYV